MQAQYESQYAEEKCTFQMEDCTFHRGVSVALAALENACNHAVPANGPTRPNGESGT
jgi:hypothetical protein